MPKLNTDFAMKIIPEFDGDRSMLHKFLTCCDIVYSDLGQADLAIDKPTLINIVKSKLSGTAYNIVKFRDFEHWADLRQQLQAEFSEQRIIIDLNDACIASEGDAAREIIENSNEKSALKAFIDELNTSIRLVIKASRFSTLTPAIEAAVEEERNIRSKPQNRFSQNKFKCRICQEKNHKTEDCYFNKPPVPSNLPKFPGVTVKREPVNVYQVFLNIPTIDQAKCKFLIDTGSQISCIKVSSLDDDAVIHDEFKVNLNGISNGTVETLGIHFGKIQLNNSINIDHSFRVVKKEFPLKNFDGILERDFLKKYKANLDLLERTLSLSINDETILLQLENNNNDNDITIPARSEKIIKVKVDKYEEMVCLKQEIAEGVYVGN
ncbi:hypothetical protein JTB14_001126 [Gonioctena quinquepunctata]|nr:hypothetical protein JTB14_001126 [Gonioctena quinquepunctata]